MVILTSFPPPDEGIVHKQESTQAHINKNCMGNGTLFIAESRLSWRNGTGEGFSLEYPAVSLHAISRDLSSFPHPCLYLMIDAKLNEDEGDSGSNDSTTEDSGSGGHISEVRFVPEDSLSLEHMYKAMCDCQVLHPDEDDTNSEDEIYGEEGQGDFYSNQADIDHLTPSGQQALQRLDQMLGVGGDSVTEQQVNTNAVSESNENGDGEMETGEEEQFEDADMDS